MTDEERERMLEQFRGRLLAMTATPWPGLTAREAQVATMIACGVDRLAIGARLSITDKTVDTHRHHVLRKLHLRGNVDLARYAIRQGLVSSSEEDDL